MNIRTLFYLVLVFVTCLGVSLASAEPKGRARPDPGDPESVRGNRPPRRPKPWANPRTSEDRDGDGILDTIEGQPLTFGNFIAPLILNPDRKDAIILLDPRGQGGNTVPTETALRILINAFDRAPVRGRQAVPSHRGVNLIVITTPGYPADSSSPLGSYTNNVYDWTDFDLMKQYAMTTYGLEDFPEIYHYAVSCHSLGGSMTSGLSRNNLSPYSAFRTGAVDFILSIQGYQSSEEFAGQTAGTLMHEFGHNLGLTHGGYDHTSYKPNYLSVMNYFFQLAGIPFEGGPIYDYSSRSRLRSLNERHIKEGRGLGKWTAGYATKMIDWDRGGVIVPVDGPLRSNIDWNLNGVIDRAGHERSLDGHPDLTWVVSENNWRNVNFTGGGRISSVSRTSGKETDGRPAQRFTTMKEANTCPTFSPEDRSEKERAVARAELAEMVQSLKPLKVDTDGVLTRYRIAD